MFTRNCSTKLHFPHVIRAATALMVFTLFNSSLYTTHAQQTPVNNSGFTLGFFSIDSNDAHACTTANSTLKIEGEALEPGDNKPRKVKLEVTFTNGVMSAKDKDNVLRNVPNNEVYGTFYYLTSHLRGHLKVKLKLEGKDVPKDLKKDTDLVDLNLDDFQPIPDESSPNQVPSVNDISEYVDFAIPCI